MKVLRLLAREREDLAVIRLGHPADNFRSDCKSA
jgi:hypothetical protein